MGTVVSDFQPPNCEISPCCLSPEAVALCSSSQVTNTPTHSLTHCCTHPLTPTKYSHSLSHTHSHSHAYPSRTYTNFRLRDLGCVAQAHKGLSLLEWGLCSLSSSFSSLDP